MGGRGSYGMSNSAEPRGRGMSLAKFLSDQDINRANAASVMDMGDIIKRTFERYAEEVKGLDLSDTRKNEAINELAKLSTDALKDAAKAVNPYASGPARLTTAQKTGSAADKAAESRGKVDSYMQKLRQESAQNKRGAENRSLAAALGDATKRGELEVSVNGKTYRRKRKNSNTWRPV